MTQERSKSWLLIDYDDTLGGVLVDGEVRNNDVAYSIAIDNFVRFMEERAGFDPEEARTLHAAVDIELVTRHGFSVRDRFSHSLVTTYHKLARKYRVERIYEYEDELFDIGESVFQHPYVALPGALETLEALRPNYQIAVVTKGNGREQHKKVADSGVVSYVDFIYSVGKKDDHDWRYVLKDLNLGVYDIPRTWAIGNSSKSDVNVPLRIGTNGIWVNQGGWAFEREPLEKPLYGRQLHQVTKINEILNYL